MKVGVKKLTQTAKIPTYATSGSACFDIYADIEKDIDLFGDEAQIISTGLSFEIPKNHVMLVFSRSGHGFTHNIRLSNCVGVIDSDYRGELKIKLCKDAIDNADSDWHDIKPGDRVAQGIVLPYNTVVFEEIDQLTETDRGQGGFGSTGV